MPGWYLLSPYLQDVPKKITSPSTKIKFLLGYPTSPSRKIKFLLGHPVHIFELLSPSHDNIQSRCEITTDKRRQNESSAIVFHMPDLHWEVSPEETIFRTKWRLISLQGYNFPRYRDPERPWILMTYESANSLRTRAYYKVHRRWKV